VLGVVGGGGGGVGGLLVWAGGGVWVVGFWGVVFFSLGPKRLGEKRREWLARGGRVG